MLREEKTMLSKKATVIILAILLPLSLFCFFGHSDSPAGKSVDQKISLYLKTVRLGKDVFQLKRELEEKGFRIQSGPSFATEDKDYYLMWVDFGDSRTQIETLEYVVWGTGSTSNFKSGLIRADADGKVSEFSPTEKRQ